MDEKELKTSPKQRIFIILIAILMLGSVIASYIAIVLSGNKTSSQTGEDSSVDEAKIAEYEEAYEAANAKIPDAAKKQFEQLIKYKSEVKAYNESAANSGGVVTRDLEEGSGRALSAKDTNYVAFYIGWCANEEIFDSSFDNKDNPTRLTSMFDVHKYTPIDGWFVGMEGTKLGGVREITIPSDLAYKDGEICDGTNKPIKFIVAPVARDGELGKIADEIYTASQRLQSAYYGIEYNAATEE